MCSQSSIGRVRVGPSAKQNGGTDIELNAVKGALTGLSDTGLRALIGATYGVPQIAPGLLAWIDSACDWELSRRSGFDYPLQPPEAAIDPSEDEVSVNAVIILCEQFTQDSSGALAFFEALLELLTGGGQKQ